MSGSVPVADNYNALGFQISKEHGWLKTLDLFRFPNQINSPTGAGMLLSPFQHERYPQRISTSLLGQTDVGWRYAPGNAFITEQKYGVPTFSSNTPAPTLGGNIVITYDSVLSVTPLITGRLAIRFYTNTYSQIWQRTLNGWKDSVFTSTAIRMDTVSNAGGHEIRSLPLYESTDRLSRTNIPAGFERRYFCDTLSSGQFFFEENIASASNSLIHSGNCWKWLPGSPDPEAHITANVERFGTRLKFDFYGSPMPLLWDKWEVVYAHMPGLQWGHPLNVLALGINAPMQMEPIIKIIPNPANNILSVSAAGAASLQLSLRSMSGQLMKTKQLHSSGSLEIADVPSGLYILEIASDYLRQYRKVEIRH